MNIACDMGYDEYNDKNSMVELMRGINRYNLTYKEKIELCILTISRLRSILLLRRLLTMLKICISY